MTTTKPERTNYKPEGTNYYGKKPSKLTTIVLAAAFATTVGLTAWFAHYQNNKPKSKTLKYSERIYVRTSLTDTNTPLDGIPDVKIEIYTLPSGITKTNITPCTTSDVNYYLGDYRK